MNICTKTLDAAVAGYHKTKPREDLGALYSYLSELKSAIRNYIVFAEAQQPNAMSIIRRYQQEIIMNAGFLLDQVEFKDADIQRAINVILVLVGAKPIRHLDVASEPDSETVFKDTKSVLTTKEAAYMGA